MIKTLQKAGIEGTSHQIRSVAQSFFNITGQDIDLDYHDMNGLPWKRTEIILSFLRLHPSSAFQTLLLTMMPTPLIFLFKYLSRNL